MGLMVTGLPTWMVCCRGTTRANASTSASARSGDCCQLPGVFLALNLYTAGCGVPVADAGKLGLHLFVGEARDRTLLQPFPQRPVRLCLGVDKVLGIEWRATGVEGEHFIALVRQVCRDMVSDSYRVHHHWADPE